MANESILISEVIPASPRRIFSALLDSAEHSALTGSQASVVPEVGGEHSAWDGYVQGRTLELHDGARIVQSWRTSEFPADSPDSRVEITLEPTVGGTLMTLHHTDIPAGQSDKYRDGWNQYYLSRMKTYFSENGSSSNDPSSDDDQDSDEPTQPLGRMPGMPGKFERTEISAQFSGADADDDTDADENEPTQETTRAAIEKSAEATWTSVVTSAKKMANAVVDAVSKAVKTKAPKKAVKKAVVTKVKKVASKAKSKAKAAKATVKKRPVKKAVKKLAAKVRTKAKAKPAAKSAKKKLTKKSSSRRR